MKIERVDCYCHGCRADDGCGEVGRCLPRNDDILGGHGRCLLLEGASNGRA